MLSCVLHDVDGGRIIMPQLLSLQVNVDEGIPADSLYAEFPYTAVGELCGVTLYDGDQMLFSGIVDEQENACGAQGDYLRISARSLAAYLIDNEAAPCTYDHPSLRLIYDRYVKPYGIALSDCDDAVYFGEQNVLKGASCWRVLKTFCAACYSSVPRVSSVGVLYPRGIGCEESVTFGENGVRYLSLREVYKRCEELSAVYVKTSNMSAYTLPIENREAIRRGIRRVRYLNAMLTESPMSCADAMIRNGKAKAYTVHLRCPSCLLGKEGMRAVLTDESLAHEELYISALHYRMTEDGEYTDVSLKRRKS